MSQKFTRKVYSEFYGPTETDCIQLADTGLKIEIQQDVARYGEEAVLGIAGTVRSGMAQGAGSGRAYCDTVITNAILLDRQRVIKADLGIIDGRIAAIGPAGNPETQPGRTVLIGPETEVISGEGKIVTPGGVSIVQSVTSPKEIWTAIRSGITTIAFGGTGPGLKVHSPDATPGAYNIRQLLQSLDGYPINTLVVGKGGDRDGDAQQVKAGAAALVVNDVWGASPEAIDSALASCEQADVQCLLRPSSLNETGDVREVIASTKDRTAIWLGIEGGLGGPIPNGLQACSYENLLPATDAASLPYTANTMLAHEGRLLNGYGLHPRVPEQARLVEELLREGTLQAEQYLNDIGAIPIVSPTNLGAGGADHIIRGCLQAAQHMLAVRGKLPEDNLNNDNWRVRRYLSKYTSNPARALGIYDYVGSITPGKRADLVIWDPAYFGVKPSLVLVGGVIVASDLDLTHNLVGSWARPQTMALGASNPVGLSFVSEASLQYGIQEKYAIAKDLHAVKDTRSVRKKDMDFNAETPAVVVDPDTLSVKVNGQMIEIPPMTAAPLARLYNLY